MSSSRISRKSVPLALLPILAAGALVLLATDAPEPAAVSPAPWPAPDRLTLEGGETLEGTLLTQGEAHVTLRLSNGDVRLIRRDRLRGLERGRQARGAPVRVRLRSGRVVLGELLERTDASVRLRLPSGTVLPLNTADVAAIESG